MAVQMPAEAVGPAAGIVVHSIISLFVGLILVWLVWVHDERKSYVMMLQSFICLHTLASIAQQIHTIVNWNDIKTDQWENIRQNVGNPELSITGASTGLDLPLFYIQYYCYNVEAMIIVCWAVELANSIFQVRVVKIYGRQFSMAAKITCVVLPIITMLLLRFSPIQNSTPAFLFVSSGIMVLCFLIGAIVLFCILFKYIYSRFALTAWDVRYGRHTEGSGTGTGNGSYRRPSLAKPRTIYDRWLVTRFSIAFVALGLFELVIVNFQLRASNTNTPDNIPPFADLSAGRAVSDFVLYIPGATAGPLTFLIFGTTRTFREYMWKAFAPKWLQRKREARRDAKRHRNKPSVVIADPNFVAAAENGNIKPLPPLPRNDEEAQYDYGEDGVKMQDLGVSAWIEGGAKAGATGMGPEAISATSSAPASPPPPPPPAVTRTHLHPNAGLGRKALGDDLSNKSETDDDFPIMKHSSRNSSRSVMIFMDRDSDVDLEAQKEVDQAGSSNFKTTRCNDNRYIKRSLRIAF